MTTVDELARRVTALEARVTAEEQGTTVLTAQYTSIVGTQDVIMQLLRDQGRLLAAHSGRFDGVDRRLDGVDGKLAGVDRRLAGVDGKLDGVDRRLDGVDGKLDGVDGKLDGVDGKLDMIVDWIQQQP